MSLDPMDLNLIKRAVTEALDDAGHLNATEMGIRWAGGTAYLKSAQSALGEVLKTHPELDQIGTIKARKSRLDAQLSGQG